MAESALYRRDGDGLVAAVVRTPAGAKRYGQPIGSVIVPDAVPQVVKRAVRAVTVPAPHKGRVPTSSEVSAARTAAKQNKNKRGWNNDVSTAAYLDAAGYNERPTVLPTQAFDAFQGKTVVNFYHDSPERLSEFWRGVEQPRWEVDPYTNLTKAEPTDFFVGGGIYSNGTYVGNQESAFAFVAESRHSLHQSKRYPSGAAVFRVKIHPDARVVEWMDIPNRGSMSPDDIVKWAVDNKYDVIQMYGTMDDRAGIAIINRSVMVVEELEGTLSAKPTFAVGSTVEWSGGGKTVQGEVLQDLGDVLLVRPPWGSPPLRLNPRRLKPVTGGAGNENGGRIASVGAPGEPGPDLSTGSAGDSGLAAIAAGLPAEGRSDLPAALGTLDRALIAAGDSWRWQLRDKNGKWIEMGSEVRYLVRGLYRQGIVVGSPSPGMADVHEHITELVRTIPSSRLEVVKSAANVVERVFDVGEEEAALTSNPALVDLVQRSRTEGVSLKDVGQWLVPDEFGPLRAEVVAAALSARMEGMKTRQTTATEAVWEKIKPQALALGFDQDEGWVLAKAIAIRIQEASWQEIQWQKADSFYTSRLGDVMNEVLHTGQIGIAGDLDTAEGVLTDGRFRTQFETNDSGGLYNPTMRATFETSLLGLHPRMNARKRTVYGYVFTPGEEGGSNLDQYGDSIRFILKPEVRARATITAGDSLDTGAVPLPLDGPDVDNKQAYMATARGYVPKLSAGAKALQDEEYFEAQIRDGVTVGDIKELIVRNVAFTPQEQAQLQRIILLCQQHGIPVRYLT